MTTTTSRPELFIEPIMAREVRMLTTLLAGCDPCGYVDRGESPDVYATMALDAMCRLRRGTEHADMLRIFPDDVRVDAAMQFIRVAIHWWGMACDVRGEALEKSAASV